MSDAPAAQSTVTFQGLEVTATKDRLWYVEAGGKSASAEYLDQALDRLFPLLSRDEQDTLLIQLLTEFQPPPRPSG